MNVTYYVHTRTGKVAVDRDVAAFFSKNGSFVTSEAL